MAPRKSTTSTDALKDAFVACTTPAQGARVLGVNGKWLRDILRKSGTYVSRGGVYDEGVRGALYDAATAKINARKASPTTDTPNA